MSGTVGPGRIGLEPPLIEHPDLGRPGGEAVERPPVDAAPPTEPAPTGSRGSSSSWRPGSRNRDRRAAAAKVTLSSTRDSLGLARKSRQIPGVAGHRLGERPVRVRVVEIALPDEDVGLEVGEVVEDRSELRTAGDDRRGGATRSPDSPGPLRKLLTGPATLSAVALETRAPVDAPARRQSAHRLRRRSGIAPCARRRPSASPRIRATSRARTRPVPRRRRRRAGGRRREPAARRRRPPPTASFDRHRRDGVSTIAEKPAVDRRRISPMITCPTSVFITAWPSWTLHGSRWTLPSAGKKQVRVAREKGLRRRQDAGVARGAGAPGCRRRRPPATCCPAASTSSARERRWIRAASRAESGSGAGPHGRRGALASSSRASPPRGPRASVPRPPCRGWRRSTERGPTRRSTTPGALPTLTIVAAISASSARWSTRKATGRGSLGNTSEPASSRPRPRSRRRFATPTDLHAPPHPAPSASPKPSRRGAGASHVREASAEVPSTVSAAPAMAPAPKSSLRVRPRPCTRSYLRTPAAVSASD